MTITYRPDLRADFSPAEWNPPLGKHVGEPTQIAVLGPHELRCACPKCGSAYVATCPGTPPPAQPTEVTITDPRLYVDRSNIARPFVRRADAALDGFTCSAGDCGYAGLAART